MEMTKLSASNGDDHHQHIPTSASEIPLPSSPNVEDASISKNDAGGGEMPNDVEHICENEDVERYVGAVFQSQNWVESCSDDDDDDIDDSDEVTSSEDAFERAPSSTSFEAEQTNCTGTDVRLSHYGGYTPGEVISFVETNLSLSSISDLSSMEGDKEEESRNEPEVERRKVMRKRKRSSSTSLNHHDQSSDSEAEGESDIDEEDEVDDVDDEEKDDVGQVCTDHNLADDDDSRNGDLVKSKLSKSIELAMPGKKVVNDVELTSSVTAAKSSSTDKAAKSSRNVESIWDIGDDFNGGRRFAPNSGRKLWSDYEYKSSSDKNSPAKPRPGSRFTNSFWYNFGDTSNSKSNSFENNGYKSTGYQSNGYQSSGKTDSGHHQSRAPGRNISRPPQYLGAGLGRGLPTQGSGGARNGPYSKPFGNANPYTWSNSRRPFSNTYNHYQHQQRYFAPPRGSYASIVRKGSDPKCGDSARSPRSPQPRHQRNDYNSPQKPVFGQTFYNSNQGNKGDGNAVSSPSSMRENFRRDRERLMQQREEKETQNHGQYSQKESYYQSQQQQQQQHHQHQQHAHSQQRDHEAKRFSETNQCSYNRGTVTAAQILQQQRMQRMAQQTASNQQHAIPEQGRNSGGVSSACSRYSYNNQQQNGGNVAAHDKSKEWQPPKGAFQMMIGNQQVYVVQPTGNRPLLTQEDPAVVSTNPATPQPTILLPGGATLSLTPGNLCDSKYANDLPTGSSAEKVKYISESDLKRVCTRLRRPIQQRCNGFMPFGCSMSRDGNNRIAAACS